MKSLPMKLPLVRMTFGPEVEAFRREIAEWIQEQAPGGLAALAVWQRPEGRCSHYRKPE
jgi:hypothetical protein